MKAAPLVALLAGLAVTLTLVAIFGAGAVGRSFVAIGWRGFLLICLIHLVLIALMGIAWRGLVPRARTGTFLAARIVREAGSEVLPLSPIGGCVIGARVLMLAAIPGAVAAASTIVDLTLEFFAKIAYTAVGLVLLLSLRPGSPIAAPLTAGLAGASLAAVGLVAAQRRGFNLFDRFAGTLGRGWADRTARGAAALRLALHRSYQHSMGLWIGFGLHLVCWIGGSVETWLALRLLGSGLAFRTVLVIDSLLYAVRTFAIVVPNALGVQEGAYVLIGAGFGLTPQISLVVSLIKRARDLAIGLPALGVWQFVEGGRLWRRRQPDQASTRIRRPAEILDRSQS
jgi:glycosyltransferase 2 family protein